MGCVQTGFELSDAFTTGFDLFSQVPQLHLLAICLLRDREREVDHWMEMEALHEVCQRSSMSAIVYMHATYFFVRNRNVVLRGHVNFGLAKFLHASQALQQQLYMLLDTQHERNSTCPCRSNLA